MIKVITWNISLKTFTIQTWRFCLIRSDRQKNKRVFKRKIKDFPYAISKLYFYFLIPNFNNLDFNFILFVLFIFILFYFHTEG